MSENLPAPVDSKILIYQSDSGETRLEVRLQDESVWLTQKMMAELFQKDVRTINEHIKNVYEEGELEPESTIRKFRIVQTEGNKQVSRLVDFYNLDMIISVGYRVKSVIATRFRQWATARLREYIVKGFTLDDERLKGGKGLVDYFDELLARIREIRASEARVYQRIREIFALARDYREGEEETQVFFATMQNKMHYAATGMTAAEIVRRSARRSPRSKSRQRRRRKAARASRPKGADHEKPCRPVRQASSIPGVQALGDEVGGRHSQAWGGSSPQTRCVGPVHRTGHAGDPPKQPAAPRQPGGSGLTRGTQHRPPLG